MTARKATVARCLLLVVITASPAAAERVRALVSPESGVTVGDPVQLLLEVELEPAQAIVTPDWSEEWLPEDLEAVELVVAGSPSIDKLGERRVWRQLLTLRAFRPGEVRLPAPTVEVIRADAIEKRLDFGEIAWTVESVLPEGEQVDLKPPSPVRPYPLGADFWLTGSILGLLVVGSGVAAVAAGAFAAQSVRHRSRDPLTELRLALQQLDPRHPDLGHVALSSSLRRFLERRTETPALERTTSEIYRDLGTLAVGDDSRRRVRDILADCDRVKFGRFGTSADQLAERARRTRSVAEDIEVRLSGIETSEAEARTRQTEAQA